MKRRSLPISKARLVPYSAYDIPGELKRSTFQCARCTDWFRLRYRWRKRAECVLNMAKDNMASKIGSTAVICDDCYDIRLYCVTQHDLLREGIRRFQ